MYKQTYNIPISMVLLINDLDNKRINCDRQRNDVQNKSPRNLAQLQLWMIQMLYAYSFSTLANLASPFLDFKISLLNDL